MMGEARLGPRAKEKLEACFSQLMSRMLVMYLLLLPLLRLTEALYLVEERL
jgi:hypothetical protein